MVRAASQPLAHGQASANTGSRAVSSASSTSVFSASAGANSSRNRTRNAELSSLDELQLRGQAVDHTWFHHDFLILECATDDGKVFLSLEKRKHAIVIQIADDEKLLKEKVQNASRGNVFHIAFEEDICKENLRLFDVIQHMMDSNELTRTYNLPLDNCQHFAQRIFEFVANSKSYPDNKKTENAIYESLMERLLRND